MTDDSSGSINALVERLALIEEELTERLRYRGWRSIGDYLIEQRLAVEADHLEEALQEALREAQLA